MPTFALPAVSTSSSASAQLHSPDANCKLSIARVAIRFAGESGPRSIAKLLRPLAVDLKVPAPYGCAEYSWASPVRTMIRPLLSEGDIAPDCILPDVDGKEINLRSDSIAGNPIVLIFCPRLSSPGDNLLRRFCQQLDSLSANGARLFAITMDKRAEVTSLQSPRIPVLLDRREQAFASFNAPRDRPSTVVLRRNHHVAGILDGSLDVQVEKTVWLLKRMAWERKTALMDVHPPVLLIPEAFSRDDCAKLINIFETKGQVFVEPQAALDFMKGADYKMRIPEHMREDRIDHFFFEKPTTTFLTNRLNRIIPEIFKAFHYRVTKYEALRMACYQGDRGGYSHGHRDNVAPYLYRRFAMSINLNTEEFEGGELRFPEFGDRRYRPESGTAIVFSSSLLHEAMQVTAGRRFVFLAFLFGEQ
jgi:peroxiredoxin